MKHCLNVDWSNWTNFFGPPKMVSVTSSNAIQHILKITIRTITYNTKK